MRGWRRLADSRGISMLELVVGSAAALLILLAVTTMTLSVYRYNAVDGDRFSQTETAALVSDWLEKDVRGATGFTVPTNPGPTVSINTTAGLITYTLSSGQVLRTTTDSTKVLAENVNALSFHKEDGRSLQVMIESTLKSGGTYQITGRVTMRAPAG